MSDIVLWLFSDDSFNQLTNPITINFKLSLCIGSAARYKVQGEMHKCDMAVSFKRTDQ